MKTRLALLASVAILLICIPTTAQEPVVGVANPDALFTSSDPQLNANKQVAYHIMRDLLEANHWDLASQFLTERYLQHNPNVASGHDPVVKYFTATRKPTPIPDK